MESTHSPKRGLIPPEGAEYLTLHQAAHMVQVCVETVRLWCKQGKLRRYGEGRTWRVRREEVIALMEGPKPSAPAPVDAREKALAILQRVRHG